MSFREKNAWIAVVTTVIVWGYYFLTVFNQVMDRAIDGQGLFTLFLICMGLTVVLLIGINLVAARMAGQSFGAPEDERERDVDRGALHSGARGCSNGCCSGSPRPLPPSSPAMPGRAS